MEPEKGFASYRGLMNQGAAIPCQECHRKGKAGEMMTYQGIVLSEEPFDFGDYKARVPFDQWKCRFGHVYKDGY